MIYYDIFQLYAIIDSLSISAQIASVILNCYCLQFVYLILKLILLLDNFILLFFVPWPATLIPLINLLFEVTLFYYMARNITVVDLVTFHGFTVYTDGTFTICMYIEK